MVSINYATREVACKIVYYGPGLSGKTTNLIYVHKKTPASTKGKMISLATEADRTLYFDFLPINIGKINGFTAKFQLYTVPGQVYYNATRKLVLRGTDGLVFVADSQPEKMDENIESLTNLKENLEEYGYDISELPIVIQYNKRDLPGVLSIEELEAKLNPYGWKYFEAEAVNGPGVFDTLKMIIKMVLEKAKGSGNAAGRKESAAPASSPPLSGTTPDDTGVEQTKPEPQPEAPVVTPASTAPSPSPSPQPEISTVSPATSVPEDVKSMSPIDTRVKTAAASGQPAEMVREQAYSAEAKKKEEDNTDIPHVQGLERNDYKVDDSSVEAVSDQVPPAEESKNKSGPVLNSDKIEAPVKDRPFPGSSTGRIARRERRITVSDFQPVSKEAEIPSFGNQSTDEEKDKIEQNNSLPSPTMAPSERVIRKKRGFFKRLFGIK